MTTGTESISGSERVADVLRGIRGGAARDRRIAVVLLVLGLVDLAVLGLWALPRALAPRPSRSASLRTAVSLPVAPATPRLAAHRLRSAIETDAGLVLEVEGHADGRGAAHFNQSLSLRRARAVTRRLRQRGVAPRHIRTAGFGATRSRTASDGLESLRGDRRVEIYVRRGLR